ncbi:MAG: hypothetical protein U5L01_05135 [Rheinheimera sp.]|nr:hypothetical protein [Rheinheimera sp.]
MLKGIMGDAASQLAAKPIEELTISNNFHSNQQSIRRKQMVQV